MNTLTLVYFASTVLWGAASGILGGMRGYSTGRTLLQLYLPGALALGIAYILVVYKVFQ